jgi:flagellar protein FlaI
MVSSEIVGLDPRSREILTNEVYRWNGATDSFEFTGRSYLVERLAEKTGISVDAAQREVRRRTQIIEWMCKQNIRGYKAVSAIIRRYYETPEAVYLEAMTGE